jgi:hypothetical protein
MHAVEDFLIARFNWYSQIVRGSGGARFDIIAEAITKHFLEKKKMYQFQDLLEMVGKDPDRFFGFNDFYFMNLIHQEHLSGDTKNPRIREMIEMLLYRKSPVEVQLPLFEQQLLARGEEGERKRTATTKKIEEFVHQCEALIAAKGDGSEWILHDIPHTDIYFAKHVDDIVRRRGSDNLLLERDPVKVVDSMGNAALLAEKEHSIIRILSGVRNFVPSFYMNEKAFELFRREGMLEGYRRSPSQK